MPAIQVARTDTFEQQRQKINQIGNQIFNVTAGGSDLSTGNLKLGNGTRTSPSLSFISQESLGFYKSAQSSIGVVSGGKIISDFTASGNYSYQDLILQKKVLTNSGSSILTSGTNYDDGLYNGVSLLGGTGDGATVNLTVDVFSGSLTNVGKNYKPGTYLNKYLTGGSGIDSLVNFIVEGIVGITQNAGTGYIPGTYQDVALTGGSGTGAKATVVIGGDIVYNSTIAGGSGYTDGTYNNIQLLNTPTQTFVVTSITNPGTPPPGEVYRIDGVTQPVLTLIKGNTYRFDLSNATMTGHPFIFDALSGFLNITDYQTISKGIPGTAGAFVDLIIKPTAATETIKYDCANHPGMGANINIVSGTAGYYGTGLSANITVSSGTVSSVSVIISGEGYISGQILSADNSSIGGGTSFTYTIDSISYTGIVTNLTVTNIGQNYERDDIISFNNSSVGGVGSGFLYEITTDPGIIKNLQFTNKGKNNVIGNILTLYGAKTNVSTTLDSISNVITVSNSSGINIGDSVTQTSGTGTLGSNRIVTSINTLQDQITLSSAPTSSGSAVLTFTPEYGTPTTNVAYTISNIGPIVGFSINNPGNGYSDQDVLTVSPYELTQPILYSVLVRPVQTLTLNGSLPANTFAVGDFIKESDGGVSIANIDSSTSVPAASGQTYTNISATGGTGSGVLFTVSRDSGGSVSSVTVTSPGTGYAASNILTIPGASVGGSTPTDNIVLSVFSVTTTTPLEVYKIYSSNNIITSIICEASNPVLVDGLTIKKVGSSTPYTINTASASQNRFFLSTGGGSFQIHPDIIFYSGNTYRFDISNSSVSSHPFKFSKFRDGKWSPSLIENLSTTLSATSKNIVVPSATGILVGMKVTVNSGSAGVLAADTLVESINGTTITLSKFPTLSGAATVTFSGVPYTDGVTVSSSFIEIQITDNTPSPLYYYCDDHPNMSGLDNQEGQITIDLNNPKIFGSGFSLLVASVTNIDIVSADIISGNLSATKFIGTDADLGDLTVTDTITSQNLEVINSTITNISAPSVLTINSQTSIAENLTIGACSIQSLTGNITTNGIIRTNNSLNVSNNLIITGYIIESLGTSNIEFRPASGKIVKIDSTTSLNIPSGTTLERPTASQAENGSIRFNTDSSQYEGYNQSTQSWSSLGGVRDIDGNTYILAELTAGANDNTLWFYNDNQNTLNLTTNSLDFRSTKNISSSRLGLPSYTTWASNTPVSLNSYVRYRNNLYKVTAAGTTAPSGSEPSHTSGATNNGTAELTWYSLAVSPLEFTGIEEIRLGPDKDIPLIINAEVKIFNNTISTLVDDLVIYPNPGKRVVVDATTHFRIPVGNSNQRSTATALAGSIRYNTTISQFEGYSGTNWSSLGGVRDVDGNTYIIPETTPGANENILYFYNDNLNTLKLTKTALDFTNIDTITTSGLANLALDTPLVTLNLEDTTIDNRDSTRTFISTSKQYLDLGLSSGLVVDPVLRLDDQGDVYLNTTFGSGTFTGVKVLDAQLKEFELADYAIRTSSFDLVKGTINSNAIILYDRNIAKGSQVTVICKSSTGKKSIATFNVIDNGTDIFYSEFGGLNSVSDIFSSTFDMTPAGETRITVTLTSLIANAETVQFTVTTQVYK